MKWKRISEFEVPFAKLTTLDTSNSTTKGGNNPQKAFPALLFKLSTPTHDLLLTSIAIQSRHGLCISSDFRGTSWQCCSLIHLLGAVRG